MQEVTAEAERVRREAVGSARQIIELAHTEAGWVLAKAREFVEAEGRAVAAEAELGAERVRSAAGAAADQLRREAMAAREQAMADLEAERRRLRDDALLDAARLREQARDEAVAFLSRLADEQRVAVQAAHDEARRIAEADSAAEVDRTIEAFLDAEDATEAPIAPEPDTEPVAQAAEPPTDFDGWLADPFPHLSDQSLEAALTDPEPIVGEVPDGVEFWRTGQVEPRRRRWWQSPAGRR
jgi:hypothetical protein